MKRKSISVATAMIAGMLLTACGAPSPGAPEDTQEAGLPEVAAPLPLKDLAQWSGVVRLNAGSNCTGTLIETGVDTAPAYVLTNGHCVGDVGRPAQKTTIDQEWFGTADFFAAAGNEDATVSIEVKRLEYSTMHTTDLGILRLDATLGQLRALGANPVPITAAEPAAGTSVTNIGVPVQDMMPEDWVLRRGECTLGAQTDLIESGWLWFGTWSNDCPGVIQGSSGSPLIAAGEIVAMINTTTGGVSAAVGGQCWLNRPCEVVDGIAKMRPDTSYAQAVAGVDQCFVLGRFKLDAPGCPLPVTDVWAENGGGSFRGGGEPDSMGVFPEAGLVGRTAGTVRTSLVPLTDPRACTKPATYQGAAEIMVPAFEDITWDGIRPTTVAVDLPPKEGRWLLCAAVVGGESTGIAVLFDVDRTVPVIAAGAEVEKLDDGGRIVMPHLNPPELAMVRYTWGAAGTVNCEDTSSFNDFLIIPLFIEKSKLPVDYCVVGFDMAGNATPVKKLRID